MILTLTLIFFVVWLLLLNWPKTVPHNGSIPHYYIRYWSFWNSMSRHVSKATYSRFSFYFQFLCGLSRIFQKEGIFILHLFTKPIVIIYEADIIAGILNDYATLDHSKELDLAKVWCEKSIFYRKGNEWRCRRKLLTKVFRSQNTEHFIRICNEESQNLISTLRESINKNYVDIQPLVTLCAFDVVCKSLFGIHASTQNNSESKYCQAFSRFVDIFSYRISRPWCWFDFTFFLTPVGRRFKKDLHTIIEFTENVIKKKKFEIINEIKEDKVIDTNSTAVTKRTYRSFLEALIRHHLEDDSFTEEDIRDDMLFFTAAGYDTATISVTWALHDIGLHQNIQESIHAELDEVLHGDKTRSITLEDLKAMKYLDRVLKESLRLHPPVPLIVRNASEQINIRNYDIKAGSSCFIFAYMMHRDPKIYPNPEKFDPDRFLPENSFQRHQYAYLPFSGGLKNCLGQNRGALENKAIVANIMRYFYVKSLDNTEDLIIPTGVVLHSVIPTRIKFRLR